MHTSSPAGRVSPRSRAVITCSYWRSLMRNSLRVIMLLLAVGCATAEAGTRVGLLSGGLREHAAVMLMIVPETGEIIDANESAASFYGQPLERLIGSRITEFNLLQPEEIAAERALAAQQKRNYFIFPHRVADGGVRTVEVYSSPIQLDDGRKVLMSIVQDASGKRLAESELLAYQTRLEELVGERTREVIEANSARSQLLISGLAVQALVILVLFGLLLSRRRLMAANRLALSRLQAVSRYSRELLEASVDPLVTIDPAGKITDVNRATEKLTGRGREVLVGSDFSDYFTEPDKARAGYREVFSAGQVIDYPLVIRNASGAPTEVMYNASLYRDERGEVAGVFAAARDITAQRRAEAELREYQNQLEALVENRTRQLDTAREQLLHSEKLSAIGQLAAGVAHEINNPLGFVSSNINTLSAYVADLLRLVEAQRDTTPTGQRAAEQLWQELEIDYVRNDVHQLLTESSEGLKRIRRIVQDLKDFSRMDRTPAFVLTNLHTCIESSLNVARNEIKYKADVVCEFGELPEVACVPSQINQVLLNLLVNAAQAIGPERGCISIRTESRGDHVRLSIGDNGAGMPEAVRRRVFEPFFTTKPLGQGTGLGLSVSFGIIQQHGGTIEVESTEGVGTVFHLILPVQQPGVEHQQTVVNR